jgi:hypothetical protein
MSLIRRCFQVLSMAAHSAGVAMLLMSGMILVAAPGPHQLKQLVYRQHGQSYFELGIVEFPTSPSALAGRTGPGVTEQRYVGLRVSWGVVRGKPRNNPKGDAYKKVVFFGPGLLGWINVYRGREGGHTPQGQPVLEFVKVLVHWVTIAFAGCLLLTLSFVPPGWSAVTWPYRKLFAACRAGVRAVANILPSRRPRPRGFEVIAPPKG